MAKEDILHQIYKKSYVNCNRRIYWDKIEKRDKKFSHLVWNLYHPDDIIVKGDGHAIHHKDKNTLNDHPYNLEKLLKENHISNHQKGKKFSEEHINNISKSKKGKKDSKETRKKKSEARKGKNNPMYGKKILEETRRKISKALKGKTYTEEWKIKHSKRMSGKNNPMYGKKGKDNPNYSKKYKKKNININ